MLLIAVSGVVARDAFIGRPWNEPKVTKVKAVYRDGQTFVTWKDAAEDAKGANYRYIVYRSDTPISSATMYLAGVCGSNILNNSAMLFGQAFYPWNRLDSSRPMSRISTGSQPLPMWSGLAVHTVTNEAVGYYAVVATDTNGRPLSSIIPGESATVDGVEEKIAPIQPARLRSAPRRKSSVATMLMSDATNLPMTVELHSSNAGDEGEILTGDYYLYFGTTGMGYRDGLPGVFSIGEIRDREQGGILHLNSLDAIEDPSGKSGLDTLWFGYSCVPQWASHTELRAYPFTHRRLLWMIKWAVEKYRADPDRVYIQGDLAGAWGGCAFGLRHPELIAAIFPNRLRVRQKALTSISGSPNPRSILMDDGTTNWYDWAYLVRYVAMHRGDLPFLGWCVGRQDGYVNWREQVELVRILKAGHHGFAFSWNNGNHVTGDSAMKLISDGYPVTLFARNRSYPAFGNSSLDNRLGNGDPTDGDLEGGINLGFRWKDVVDEPGRWSVSVSNSMAQQDMVVDVTPRRCQKFHPAPGARYRWVNTAGGSGEIVADQTGLVTVEKVRIRSGEYSVLTVTAAE